MPLLGLPWQLQPQQLQLLLQPVQQPPPPKQLYYLQRSMCPILSEAFSRIPPLTVFLGRPALDPILLTR